MFYTVILSKRVTEGTRLDLIIPFKGKILSGETIGFYAFPDDAGGEMAVTQFESMNARMAYPCFDEPRSQGCLLVLGNPYLHIPVFCFISLHIFGLTITRISWFPVTKNRHPC